MNKLKFSVIVPVFNRPDEIRELLESLASQANMDFEVIIVEDGSSQKCESIVESYSDKISVNYFFKQNTGPGDSRNFGANLATGDYLIFFDSDCVIPQNYFNLVSSSLSLKWLDMYGGPDKVQSDAGTLQKAINYSMTSFITTGGIRGHLTGSKSFQPRSFNMGVSRKAFAETGGFSNIHPGEDPDLVYRLAKQRYIIGLIPEAFVFHKRRVNFSGFARQVYKFGLVRTVLMKWHPASRKPVFLLPLIAGFAGACCFLLGFSNPIFWYLILLCLAIIFIDGLLKTGNPITAIVCMATSVVQICAYGWGFFKGSWQLLVRRRDEQLVFPFLFMGP